MDRQDRSGNDGRANVLITFIVVSAVILGSLAIVSVFRGSDTGLDEDESPHAGEEIISSSFVNFTLDNNTVTSKNADGKYNLYSVNYPKYTNNTANETIKKYFISVLNDTSLSFKNHNDSVFAHVGVNHTYSISSDGRIFYNKNIATPGYPVDSIAKNSSLMDLNQSKAPVESYINKTIGEEFKDLVFEKAGTSKGMNQRQWSIHEYVFWYERKIDNVSCFKNSGGQIVVSISPDGTITQFQYQRLDLKYSGTISISNVTKAMEKVDLNFDIYSKNLYLGYEYTLFHVESAYGLVDGKMKIGWQLYFYCDDDKTKITSTFVD